MSISRRRFIHDSGLVVGTGICGLHTAWAQEEDDDPINAFLPCVDYPIRRAANDPPEPTPVEYALEIAEDRLGAVEGVPRSPAGAQRGLDVLSKAPRSPGDAVRAPARLAAMNRWSVDVLRVSFLGGTTDLQDAVLEIAREWTPYCGIRFEGASGSNGRNAEIHCGFITNRSSPHYGHWSFVGTDSAGKSRSMNLAMTSSSLGSNSYHQAVVRHEFGHALGCIHEHQNPGANGIKFDPEKTKTYFARKYGWSTTMTENNVLKRYSARTLQRFSDFDPDSIMLYAYPDEITVDGRGTKQNFGLSRTDKQYMAELYDVTIDNGDDPSKPDPPPNTVRDLIVDAAPLEAAITPSTATNTYRIKITEAHAYIIRTQGYTQLAIKQLTDSNGDAVDLQNRLKTLDLVNFIAEVSLSAGEYKLEVVHRYSGGVGEYKIGLQR